MHKVESKFKNPDKYVERLKDQLKEAWEMYHRRDKENDRLRGQYWFVYAEGRVTGYEKKSEKKQDITFTLDEVRLVPRQD